MYVFMYCVYVLHTVECGYCVCVCKCSITLSIYNYSQYRAKYYSVSWGLWSSILVVQGLMTFLSVYCLAIIKRFGSMNMKIVDYYHV